MHKMRWDDLQFVYSVAEHGSLSAASRVLGVNHATVLRRIALLEAKYDIVIFDRARDGYKLRPEGRNLLSSLRVIERESARIERNLAVSARDIAGSFRLSTTDSIANLLLPGYLKSLRNVHPDLHLEISVSNLSVNMDRPGTEILIRTGNRLAPELHGANVGAVSFEVFGAPDYLARNPDPDLEAHRWLGVTSNFAQSTAGDWQFSRVAEFVEMSADSFLTLSEMAAAGLGLAILPRFVGLGNGNLVQAEQFPGGPTTGLWVATHQELLEQPHVNTLLEFFIEAMRTDDRLLA